MIVVLSTFKSVPPSLQLERLLVTGVRDVTGIVGNVSKRLDFKPFVFCCNCLVSILARLIVDRAIGFSFSEDSCGF